ncbi:MAG: DNA-processing protein DprA [Gemmatimonadota bacterium]
MDAAAGGVGHDIGHSSGVVAINRSISALVRGSSGYPRRLLSLPDPPDCLYCAGDTSRFDNRAVAVVGSRSATPYGIRVTRRITSELAQGRITIISGLAFGIDAEAHLSTLEAGGHTVAVLGTGVDVPYPRAHDRLHDRIAREGTIVSECAPGARAHRGSFPRRNRLIAALAEVTVVIEAGARSGALITARIAGEIGRSLAAVPGPVDVPTSAGSNGLLASGAQVVTCADDVFALLELAPRTNGDSRPTENGLHASLRPDERKLLEVLESGPRFTDELAMASGLTPREVVELLAALEVDGKLERAADGLVRCVSRSGAVSF